MLVCRGTSSLVNVVVCIVSETFRDKILTLSDTYFSLLLQHRKEIFTKTGSPGWLCHNLRYCRDLVWDSCWREFRSDIHYLTEEKLRRSYHGTNPLDSFISELKEKISRITKVSWVDSYRPIFPWIHGNLSRNYFFVKINFKWSFILTVVFCLNFLGVWLCSIRELTLDNV